MTTLRGTWTLTAVENEAGWAQGIFIAGSATHDGIHKMILGDKLENVRGETITVTPQAFNPATQAWELSNQQDKVLWDPMDGLVVMLYADDNPSASDGDFNDLVVKCVCQDHVMKVPPARPLDLTLPESAVGHLWREAPWRNR